MPDQYKEELFVNQAICDVYFTMQRVLCHEKNSNTANWSPARRWESDGCIGVAGLWSSNFI